ncbi:hypothetical protein ELH92_25905 [Rhizobium ruizarguesonis]|uniref:hypothetical protein n=1 Tax=Rhizobium ruizarguesonis TaxID=2081791 RepID=UPI0010300E47|nr:hypothetical protein [Rhizobium ruizarguesonis]TAY24461.1 hypothetical protein ELH92_25905 [Rhizobium ruizarguesonis]
MNMVMIERGKKYPLPLGVVEGAMANFLMDGGNSLLIGMPDIQRSEAQVIMKGPMKAGFIKDGPLILWVFEFAGNLIFDCPFDARIIPKDRLTLPDVANDQQRLLIDIHLVDTASKLVNGIKVITLSPKLSLDFLLAAQDQIADTRGMAPFLTKYTAIDILRLPKLAAVQLCGEN